jgi:hypothetical protein
MTEKSETTQTQQKEEQQTPINWKGNAILGFRFLQFFAMTLVAVGFIWALGDYINTLMPNGEQAPISTLMMLYGLIGTAMIEVPIKLLQRKK